MNSFLARQPIFDAKKEVHAFEILYRSGLQNHFSKEIGSDTASSRVIVDTFQNFGLENLTGGRPAFINFPATLLEQEIATLFPREYLVVELLETVEPSLQIVEKCRKLKDAGYTIALDDFVYQPEFEPLMDLADIIKIDFRASSQQYIEEFRDLLGNRETVLLAEKVETWDEFHFAKGLGFDLFQGYFFSKPEILTTSTLSPLEITYFQLIEKVNRTEIDFADVAEVVSRDVSLTYNLIKLVNAAYFGKRQRINSVKQALVFLGEREIRKWITLISLQGMNVQGVAAPVSLSLIRARFAELIAESTQLQPQREELFLTGLFSMLDVLLQRPMPQILDEIQAPPPVKEVLLYGTGPFADICAVILAYERGEWDSVGESVRNLNLQGSDLTRIYLKALTWHPLVPSLEGTG